MLEEKGASVLQGYCPSDPGRQKQQRKFLMKTRPHPAFHNELIPIQVTDSDKPVLV